MKTIVVVPTYNEKDNIVQLIRKILLHNVDILVVDDNSPDGTWKLVEEISKKEKRVKLHKRIGERGRGTAGIAGFKDALKQGYDCIIEMDADFSHNPDDIPRLLDAIRNADIVLGSRLVKEGRQIGRSSYRKLLTSFANNYIRTILGMKIKDCNSGYRCFRKKVLEGINLDSIKAKGPDIVQEILYKAYLKGFKIIEIPIVFTEREKGSSKLGMKHHLMGYTKVLNLKWEHLTGKI